MISPVTLTLCHLSIIDVCNSTCFPNICKSLTIFATLLVRCQQQLPNDRSQFWNYWKVTRAPERVKNVWALSHWHTFTATRLTFDVSRMMWQRLLFHNGIMFYYFRIIRISHSLELLGIVPSITYSIVIHVVKHIFLHSDRMGVLEPLNTSLVKAAIKKDIFAMEFFNCGEISSSLTDFWSYSHRHHAWLKLSMSDTACAVRLQSPGITDLINILLSSLQVIVLLSRMYVHQNQLQAHHSVTYIKLLFHDR